MGGAAHAAAPDYPVNKVALGSVAYNVIAAQACWRTRVKATAGQEAATGYLVGMVGGRSSGYSFGRVIRLKGRRTPHQDLKGPLVEITQPSISNQWVTGRPPLVLISHPSGMTPDEERFYTENRSTCLSQNWAWMGTLIHPSRWVYSRSTLEECRIGVVPIRLTYMGGKPSRLG